MMLRVGAVVFIMVCVLTGQAFSQTEPPPPSQPPAPQPQEPVPPQPPATQEPAPQAVPAPPPTKIIPGVGIAGVLVGGNARALRVRFGLPSQVLQRGEYTVHLYNRFGLVVYVRMDTIAAVATTNSLFRIQDSLRVGHPAADARAAFGAPSGPATVAGFQGDLYDDRGVGFGIERGWIATIVVFRPGEGRVISTL
jgi:hypothetical protein